MRKIILALILITMFTSCGRSPKKAAVILPSKETNLIAKDNSVTINILSLHDGDWEKEWMKWKLACTEFEVYSVKIERGVVELPLESIGREACTLKAVGAVPDELKSKYVTTDGIFYTAAVASVKTGRQTVEASKKYGTSADDNQTMSEELVAITKDGDKCADFDLETFDCK